MLICQLHLSKAGKKQNGYILYVKLANRGIKKTLMIRNIKCYKIYWLSL